MALQYVVVNFSEDREVLVDGIHNGQTNQSILVGAGTHEFTLGGIQDFTPPNIKTQVTGTSALDPLILSFTPTTAEK